MQPPSEADVVAATESLEVRRDLKLAQVATLQTIQACLGRSHPADELTQAASAYLGHLITEHRLDSEVLEAQIAHNNRIKAALRSNLVLPHVGARRPVS
jgi:hypothetical protein